MIFASFSVSLWMMFKPFQKVCTNSTLYYIEHEKLKDNKGFRGITSFLFWRIFDGDFSEAQVLVNKSHSLYNKSNFEPGQEFSLEFSHLMGLVFCAIYQGIMVLMLINILIAMMNSTYSKLWENSDMEWKFNKSVLQVN